MDRDQRIPPASDLKAMAEASRRENRRFFCQDPYVRFYDMRPFGNKYLDKIPHEATRVFRPLASWILPGRFRRQRYRPTLNPAPWVPVVCLTSFPLRIHYVWLVVECLLRQQIMPGKIVLYLSREQFPTPADIPASLREYPAEILDIRMVDGDIRSHKKYWYAVGEFPGRRIITVDDDVVYPTTLVSSLLITEAEHPGSVPARFCNLIKRDGDALAPYSQWGWAIKPVIKSGDVFFGSGGGTLFPPGALQGADIDIGELMRMCPLADDVWLNAVIRSNGFTPAAIGTSNSINNWQIKDNLTLASLNVDNNDNDWQIANVQRYFKNKHNINNIFGR